MSLSGDWFHITKPNICWNSYPLFSWVMWNIGTFTKPCRKSPESQSLSLLSHLSTPRDPKNVRPFEGAAPSHAIGRTLLTRPLKLHFVASEASAGVTWPDFGRWGRGRTWKNSWFHGKKPGKIHGTYGTSMVFLSVFFKGRSWGYFNQRSSVGHMFESYDEVLENREEGAVGAAVGISWQFLWDSWFWDNIQFNARVKLY